MGLSRATILAATVGLGLLFGAPAGAVEIDVANYGVGFSSAPFAIALEKGFFRQAGADVTAVVSSPGGGADVRMLIGGDLPYAESSLAGVIAAIQKGADLKIIAENNDNISEVTYVALDASPIRTLADLKGRRIGYTNPQSATQMLNLLLLEKAGLGQGDVRMIATGGFGPMLTALEHDGIDVAPLPEPSRTLAGARYRTIASAADVFPPLANGVAVTSRKTLHDRPDLLRGIIAGRRMAVEYMATHRPDSAAIIARIWKIEPAVAAAILDRLLDHGTVSGVPFFGLGGIDWAGMHNAERALGLIGLVKGDIDWSTMVDESVLPEDLQTRR